MKQLLKWLLAPVMVMSWLVALFAQWVFAPLLDWLYAKKVLPWH